MTPESITRRVQKLYDTYPFPPEPLLDSPPPGYNWRWNWIAAYNFCTGIKPKSDRIKILDAGCGTGVGTEYLVHLNPLAQISAIDLSSKALAIATERCQRSGADRVEFHNLSIYDLDQLSGEQFDLINCVGVLHHLSDPIRGIKALADKLAPGGLCHIFVYSELGRREIQLMQQAISMLQSSDDYTEAVKIGRKLFATLPSDNRIVKRERERWSLENHRDECFADMYAHPQEIDYNVDSLFELIDASGLDFVGFSNPLYWNIARLIGADLDLMERVDKLSDRQRYRLTELLDPDITHYEFFLARPPLIKIDWSEDAILKQAVPEIHPCIDGWPSRCLFNYEYMVVELSEIEFQFMQACNGQNSVEDLLQNIDMELGQIRKLQLQQLIILKHL